ncbi:hypothetical protein CJ030_MR8G016424 [Morella rubra]|uniref:Uncharacterized protein n=1 Tax=Morella rubra TaxID=262757 RepID=A0A6A1UV24_9ROSI|nr:hypothetical protein CJ030_MR8G016424 [Morella rubra]
MAINRDSTPPPVIGKIGPYTVFMTPPSTPKPAQPPVFDSPKKIVTPPPVQPPPQQFPKSIESLESDGSVVGFFKNAVTKVQHAHSSLDDHLARWFGLNQSKYQWALDDYYESKGVKVVTTSCKPNYYVFGSRKFGGNAQSVTKNRWIHRTSFLWDYEVRSVAYLKPPARAPEYRSRSLPTNLTSTERVCTYGATNVAPCGGGKTETTGKELL